MKNGKKKGNMLNSEPNSEMYHALRAAGIPAEHAQRVAAELAKTDIYYHALDQSISSSLRSKMNKCVAR